MTADGSTSPRSEWAANWPLLLTAIVSIPVPAVMSYLLGQFMAPLEQEFGWSRSQASVGYSVSLVLGFLATPLVGRMVDAGNVRRLALAGLALTGCAIAAFSFATSSIVLWIGLWCCVALSGALAGPVVWIAVISAAFEKNRSLAIAITLSGMSLAATLAPLSARLAIDAFGWRMAWVALGATWSLPALVLSALFFVDRRPARGTPTDKTQPAPPKPQLRRVFASGTFIRLSLAIVSIGLLASSFSLHMAPALTGKGFDATTAASLAGLVGLAGIAGRLVLGGLFDRIGQTAVTCTITALYALSAAILALDSTSLPLAITACIVLGLASGALGVAIACIAARLFDPAIFGTVYGMLISISTLAAAVGPLTVSAIHDSTGNYAIAFWGGTLLAGMAGVLFLGLRPVSAVLAEPAIGRAPA